MKDLKIRCTCHKPRIVIPPRDTPTQHDYVWGGVTIGIIHPDQGVVANGLTDRHGRYSISRLSPGHYRVWLQLGRTGPGYFLDDIDLRDGQNTLDIVSR
jgi:hypothetical protein